jgi:hypothetical protein
MRDEWAEAAGDDAMRKELWQNLHRENEALLEKLSALAALPSPAEAGEKPLLVWSECVHGGLIKKGGACMYCPPAAPSDAKAGQARCHDGRLAPDLTAASTSAQKEAASSA